MTLALDLSAQLWPLLELVLAIFQPAVVLLLCGGVVVASMHLFAMLATQWGNRRVTGKALIFSLGIHGSLIFGVVALIPEYQPRFIRTLFDEEHAVDVTMDSSGFSEVSGSSDAGGVFDPDATNASVRQPWDRIGPALALAPERTQVVVPGTAPSQIAPFDPRPPRQAVSVPDPVFVPLSPSDLESSQLVKVDVPHDYNPAAYQPAMDVVNQPEPSRTPSRAAPAIPRNAPALSSIPSGASLSRITRPDASPATNPVENPLATDFNPGVDTVLPSALPGPDADVLPEMQPEQLPSRSGSVPFQISDTTGSGTGPAGSTLPPQAPAPAVRPTRSVPRSLTGAGGGLAKIERPTGPAMKGTANVEGSDPVLDVTSNDPGMVGLPNLIRPPGLLPMSLGSSSPAQYQLRTKEQRGQALQQFGGTAGSEAAVDLALKWLASIQDSQGFWDGDAYGAGKVAIEGGINREFAGRDADTGLTALSVLAFLGKQNTLEEGDYSANVTQALHWLVEQQGKNSQGLDGYLGGNAAEIAGMYSHAIATFAIAEAYAMTKDQTKSEFLLEPLQKAVGFTLQCQLDDGGWRYKSEQSGGGDMSIFGWQLMALKSAQAAGLEIPLATRKKMNTFLQQRGLGKAGGLAAYRANERPSVAMTAESLFCKQMLGLSREHPSCNEAVNFLLANPPHRQSLNLYTWYYSTLAMFQYGGEEWDRWNVPLRDLLISEQVIAGPNAGSWEPRDQWGGYGGRIYSTAFAALTLEVYYRYLPLYRTAAPVSPQNAEPVGEPSLK
jgi:hypothetical protein